MTPSWATGRIAEPAPAKVNLYLHVLGRRADGYHLLDSLVVFADEGDRIEVAPADDLRLTVSGPFAADVPAGADNLVLRAARALAAAAHRPPAAAIRLEKRLPVASGVGGGSADAAAVLRALVRLWDIAITDDALAGLALSLGADVPMCLHGWPMFVGGIGEEIEPAPPLPGCGLVLVNPRVLLPTPQVFKARTGDFSALARFQEPPADAADAGGVAHPTQQRPDRGGSHPGSRSSERARRIDGGAGSAAGADERQRRHLLWPVRRPGGGAHGGGSSRRPASGLVDHRSRRGRAARRLHGQMRRAPMRRAMTTAGSLPGNLRTPRGPVLFRTP